MREWCDSPAIGDTKPIRDSYLYMVSAEPGSVQQPLNPRPHGLRLRALHYYWQWV